MLKHRRIRTKGKVPFSKYFQQFKEGDVVAVTKELGFIFGYKHTLQGRTGRIISKKGEAYEVEVKDLNCPKTYFLRPIHLKKIQLAK